MKLTPSQQAAIFPGPGNPEYARGPASVMKKLEEFGLVKAVSQWSVRGGRSATLTDAGKRIREELAKETS